MSRPRTFHADQEGSAWLVEPHGRAAEVMRGRLGGESAEEGSAIALDASGREVSVVIPLAEVVAEILDTLFLV